MFQLFKSHLKDPETLRDDELESTFIDLKNKIVVTDAHDNATLYRHLYDRVERIVGRILARHQRYYLEIEAKATTSDIFDLLVESQSASWEPSLQYPNRKLSMGSKSSELLLFLCFFAYLGGRLKTFGEVRADPEFAVKVLSYLIDERHYVPAAFFKGFICKYGIKPYIAPKLDEAKALLEGAAAAGDGGAIIELRQFNLHVRLNEYAKALDRL